LSEWVSAIIRSENKSEGEINYIFCNDEYLLKLNKEFLKHDTYTDVIGFDNSLGDELHGDIFISHQRVEDNASLYKVTIEEERRRVMAHGVLHFCGYKDKTNEEALVMKDKEEEKLKMFHVER